MFKIAFILFVSFELYVALSAFILIVRVAQQENAPPKMNKVERLFCHPLVLLYEWFYGKMKL